MKHLASEMVQGETYWFGDTMYDIYLNEFPYVVEREKYVLSTIHRPFNTDNKLRLSVIFNELGGLPYDVVLPAHPRLIHYLDKYKIKVNDNINIEPPMDYTAFIALMKHAECVITDSGGAQKEAFWSNPYDISEKFHYTVNSHHPSLNIEDEFGYGDTSKKIVDWMISEFNIKYDKVN